MHVSRPDIDRACNTYLRNQPRKRPTPADILRFAESRPQRPQNPQAEGDRTKLSLDEQRLLDDEILPTARRWLEEKPGLARHAMKVLAFWGEAIPKQKIQRLQEAGYLERDGEQ